MHFLSHYYIDKDRQNAHFTLGGLLPDIAPHFTKTYNTTIRKTTQKFEEPMDSIHRGVLRHYELDAIFHNSVAFKEACANASKCLIDTGMDREKYRFWFLAHIVVEVLLDRQLIVADPNIVQEYYKVLNSVDINKFDAYLNFIVPKDEKSRILSNFIRFLDVKFLQYLAQMDGAAEAVIRTVLRATGVNFTDGDRERLMIGLHNIENDIRYRRKKLLVLPYED